MSGSGWQVRIDTESGAVRGAGLLVSDKQVLTCAHVVAGLDRVTVAFPLVGGEQVGGEVKRLGPWQRQGDPGDLAVVVLDYDCPAVPPCEFADMDALRPRGHQVNHRLRALGFSRNLDVNGSYATVTSSSDRVLGDEWLQIDADQAHLQLLEKGFSGAGLFLPESGKVVGIITDAVLGGDRGGCIGRMLPLSTIRRHWAELDDLLPASWLESKACRAELRAAMMGAVVKADLRSVIRSALPVLCKEDLRTPWEAIRYVGESVVGDDRLRKFLVALAPHLDSSARSRLIGWARGWREEWVPEIGHARAPVASVVVTLRTPTKSGRTNVQVAVRSWVNGEPDGPEEVAIVHRDKVREKVEQFISAQVRRLGHVKFMVEFAVRADEAVLPFDEWRYKVPDASRELPLRSVPVVVSNVARFDPVNVIASRVSERWKVLRDSGKVSPEPVDCDLEWGYDEFYSWLDADEKLAVLAYASSPKRDWMDAALDIGVPVMLLRRGSCPGDDGGHAAHMALLGELMAALAGTDPLTLPDEVARLRKLAARPGFGDQHYGRHLTLYWENPARLPDPPVGVWG